MLKDRQAPNFGPGPELMRLSSYQSNSDNSPPPPDTPPTPTSPPKDCDGTPTKNKQLDFKSPMTAPGYPVYPWVAAAVRRYFQNSMRRRSEGPSDILGRDSTANATAPTADDVFAYYFTKALVGSKRSGPTFDRDVN
jgi:hypothetical protein